MTFKDGQKKIGFINAIELPNPVHIGNKISTVAHFLSQDPAVLTYEDLTQERIEKALRMIFRRNLAQAKSTRFIESILPDGPINFEQVEEIFLDACKKSTASSAAETYWERFKEIESEIHDQYGAQIAMSQNGDEFDLKDPCHPLADEIGNATLIIEKGGSIKWNRDALDALIQETLEQEGQYPPIPDLDQAYEIFIDKLFPEVALEWRGQEDVIESLDRATTKAVGIVDKIAADLSSLKMWLREVYPEDANIKQVPDISTLVEYKTHNFFEILYAGLTGTRRLAHPKTGDRFLRLDRHQQFLAQMVANTANLLFWLESDPIYRAGANHTINKNIERALNVFWADYSVSHELEDFSYSTDQAGRLCTEKEATDTWPQPVRQFNLEALNIPDVTGTLRYWRRPTQPKTDISTILKVLIQNLRPDQIADMQRSEVVVALTKDDLDISPSKDPLRAKKNHTILEAIAQQHCESLGLKPAQRIGSKGVDYTKNYQDIPPGSFVIVNKAEWNSDENTAPKKGFLAVKAYYRVPINKRTKQPITDFKPNEWYIEGVSKGANKKQLPVAYVVPREIRFIPYDLAHFADKDPHSTLGWDFFKMTQACQFVEETIPEPEFPEFMPLVKYMRDKAKASYDQELSWIFGFSKHRRPNGNSVPSDEPAL